ncbi:hypothetical protein BDV32DRAFT_102815 [Aspergillus pseudonomiae]|nr:hypothetical protein BDV32DRAFT_102815 [Aspergillus pseudonomiae]
MDMPTAGVHRSMQRIPCPILTWGYRHRMQQVPSRYVLRSRRRPISIPTDRSMAEAQVLTFDWLPSRILYVYTAIIPAELTDKLDKPASALPSCPVEIRWRAIPLKHSKRVLKRLHDIFCTGSCARCISKTTRDCNQSISGVYSVLGSNACIPQSSKMSCDGRQRVHTLAFDQWPRLSS